MALDRIAAVRKRKLLGELSNQLQLVCRKDTLSEKDRSDLIQYVRKPRSGYRKELDRQVSALPRPE